MYTCIHVFFIIIELQFCDRHWASQSVYLTEITVMKYDNKQLQISSGKGVSDKRWPFKEL